MEKYLDFKLKIEYNKLKEVAKCIKNGGMAIFPTETVYGIGCNVFDENAVKRIYELKKRPKEKPISLLISNLSMIKDISVDVSNEELKIMKAFFPGPITLILKKSKKISDIVTAGMSTVGVRMPKNEIALNLIEEVRLSFSNF